MKVKDRFILIMVFVFLIIAFFYRFYGLGQNYSFWTDETQTAIFSRAILQRGFPVLENGYTPTIYLPFWYYLPAFPMKIFGINELAVRLPSVIFGTLTIWIVFLLGKELFNKYVGWLSALFVVFLKIEILWSRQARPYQLLQLFYLLSVYFFVRFLNLFAGRKGEKLKTTYFVLAIITSVLAAAIHPLGLLLFVYFAFYLLLFRRDIVKEIYLNFNKIFSIFLIFILISLLWQLNLFIAIKNFFYGWQGERFEFYNNLYYYRVFLWQDYGFVSILSFFGLILALIKKLKINIFLIVLLTIHLSFISFRLEQPFVRYLYPVFPFLIILFAFFLTETVLKFFKKENLRLIALFCLALLIIIFNHKFSLRPQKTYSLNEDMQEIPEVDYKKIYSFVGPKLKDNPEAVYIANWNDHAVWYLGEGSLDYLLRTTKYDSDIDPLSGALYIKDLDSLEKTILENKKGLILLESWESELPLGTREYIRENLKKEYEVDRLYPVQPRLWPVEIYSWGI